MLTTLNLASSPNPNIINIEAITLYIYKSYFILEAAMKVTGITSRIKIDKKSHQIQQMSISLDSPLPNLYEKKISYSAFLGILPILNKTFLIFAEQSLKICSIQTGDIYQVKQIGIVPFEPDDTLVRNQQGNLTEKSAKINDQNTQISGYLDYLKYYILTEGYYYSFRYNLTLSRAAYAEGYPAKKKFIWNLHMAKNLEKLPDRKWFVPMIQGSVISFKINLEGTKVEYFLITRRSWMKGGTRYNSRGVDLKGNVANFCETEQIIFINDLCFSHVQIRGSVPVFWKQTGLYAEVEFYKSTEQNVQSFQNHYKRILRPYQKVLNINLLCKHKEGELDLILYYERLMQDYKNNDVKYEYFDVHCACKGQKFQKCNYLIDKIARVNTFFQYFTENTKDKKVLSIQNGVVRVNCLDNLDRTNLIQSKIAYSILTTILVKSKFNLQALIGSDSILTAADNAQSSNMLLINLKNAWADNGDMISKHYTGTGSTHTSVTRKGARDIKGLVDHGFKTCKRLYQQYVEDNKKQQIIDILIGEHTETINLGEILDRLQTMNDTTDETDNLQSSVVNHLES